ncbi:MAG TPA: FHA domain-containing protein [Chloroflexi bacterium]|nr:FHA domain-containing protein [Chloroflexota bacterium]
MGAGKDRLDLTIDVLELPAQHAAALWTLAPQELIAATLQEFRELEQLGIDPGDYQLLDAQSGAPLDEKPLDDLFAKDAKDIHLKLVEKPVPVPRGAQSAPEPLYLREQATGRVYRLGWLPAIIGRPDRNLPDNHLLAVNLEALPTGLRVSRRHVRLSEQGGQYFVQRMSGNPTVLRRTTGETINLLDASRMPIDSGDLIVLERSQITLKFLIRRAASLAPEPQSGEEATTGVDNEEA